MDIPGSDGINVYADAKSEYTRQLSQFSLSPLTSYFLKMLEETKEAEKESKKLLLSFQNALKSIPEWNHEKVQKETNKIEKDINCDYYEELLSAVFIAHTKVLSAIRLTSKQKKLQITIPKVEHFLHHTLIECARILWSNVFLFNPSGTAIERQKNLRQIEQLIHDGILQSIRSMLPVKNILKEYLKDDDDEEEEEPKVETAVEEIIPPVADEELPVLDIPEEHKKQEQKQQEHKENSEPFTIEVDTEPSVKFSDVDTVFSYENLDDNDNDNDNDNDDESDTSSVIEILDTKGENISEFEELDKDESIEFEILD